VPNEPTQSGVRVFDADALLNISRSFDNHRVVREQVWHGYTDGDHWGAIPFVSELFRGQNGRYLPMLPAIARGLEIHTGVLWERSPRDQAKIVLRLAQSWWFARELDHHPITSHAASQKLKLDRIALAQHYGIPTGYLDLTDDFNVGAFFATCRETREGWEPIEEGVGIVYRVDLKGLENPFGRYEPLGPQLLPRPTEQCAWVAELPIAHSFDGWPGVMMMQFNQQKPVGEHFLRKFDEGKGLFPPDPLADVAGEIMACQEVPTILIERAIESFAGDPLGIRSDQIAEVRRELSKLTTTIDYRRLLTEEHVSSLRADFEWRKRMLSDVKVRWRAVRAEPASVDDERDAAVSPADERQGIGSQASDIQRKNGG
jgi:hypothetical protein